MAISSAKAIGCVIISITPPLILEKREHIILGILWQILRVIFLEKNYIYYHKNKIDQNCSKHQLEEPSLFDSSQKTRRRII